MIELGQPVRPIESSPPTMRRLPSVWLWITRSLWITIFLAMVILNTMAIRAQLERNASGMLGGSAGLRATLNEQHLYALRVDPKGPAAQLDLQTGDLLLAINGVDISPNDSYQTVNRQFYGKIGDPLTVTVQNGVQQVEEHTLTLVEEDLLQIWRRFRVPLGMEGNYLPTLEAILLGVYLLTSALIFWRRNDDWLAIYLTLTLVLITPQLSYSWYYLGQTAAHWEDTFRLIIAVAVALTLPNFYLLPNGRFVPRWAIVPTVAWVLWSISTELFPTSPLSIYRASGATQLWVWLAWYATGMVAQVYRYRYEATPAEKEQIKWVAFGLTVAVVVNLGWTLAFELFPVLGHLGQAHEWMWLIGRTVYIVGMMTLPISFGIAIFLYRLWDVDILINRTLVYGTLTAIVVGIYVVVVTALDLLFSASGTALSQIIALSLDLVLFEPLRERLQKGVDRLMFGESEDLPVVIARLGQRLSQAEGAEVVLPTIVETLAGSLNLPYVAIALREGDGFRVVASLGTPIVAYFTWPLVYQKQAVGQLILAPRAVGEPFKPAELEVIQNVVFHVSVAVHDLLLDNELHHRKVTVSLK